MEFIWLAIPFNVDHIATLSWRLWRIAFFSDTFDRVSQLMGLAVARDSMINIHWVDVHGKEGNGASEDNDKPPKCLSLRIRRELLRET